MQGTAAGERNEACGDGRGVDSGPRPSCAEDGEKSEGGNLGGGRSTVRERSTAISKVHDLLRLLAQVAAVAEGWAPEQMETYQ